MGTNSSQGTLLQLSIASVFTTIAQRVTIKPAENKRNKIETIDLDSIAETSIPGIPRSGEVEMEGNLDPGNATHAALWASYGLGTTEAWKTIYTDAGACVDAFSGWISEFTVSPAETDKLQRFTMKIQISGVVTRTP